MPKILTTSIPIPLRGKDIAPGQQLTAAAYYLNGGREAGYPNLFLFQPVVQYVNGAEDMRAGSKYIRDDFFERPYMGDLLR